MWPRMSCAIRRNLNEMYLQLKFFILGRTEFFQKRASHVPNRILVSSHVGIHVLHCRCRVSDVRCCRTVRRLESIRKLWKLLSLELRTIILIADEDRVMLERSGMGHMDWIHSRLWQGMNLLRPGLIAIIHGRILELIRWLLHLRSLLDLSSGVVERRRTTLSLKLGRGGSLRGVLPVVVVFVLERIEFIVRLRAGTTEFYSRVRAKSRNGIYLKGIRLQDY